MNIINLFNALPGAVAQGLIWGIMAIGVYITFRILDIADLTVDGTLCTGGAVCIMLMQSGQNVWVALISACWRGRGRYGDGPSVYIYGDSGDFVRYFNTAWAVFGEFENNGKGESGHQRG